jgi:hypothetical protein
MKKLIFTLWGSLFMIFLTMNVFSQNLSKIAPQVIIVNLGPKNPHFDESIYPHLSFFYTPQIKAEINSEEEINKSFRISGEPDFLAKAYNEHKIKQYGFLLFDKNGICYTEGSSLTQNFDVAKALCTNGKELADNIKDVMKKGKTATLKKEPLSWGKTHAKIKMRGLGKTSVVKSEFMVGHPFPEDVKVESPDGKKIVLEDVIKQKPALIVFLYIPPTGNLETLDKYYDGDLPKPSKAIQKKYAIDAMYLLMFEAQIFDFNSKKALKEKYGK